MTACVLLRPFAWRGAADPARTAIVVAPAPKIRLQNQRGTL
jgi:hypothetical protein